MSTNTSNVAKPNVDFYDDKPCKALVTVKVKIYPIEHQGSVYPYILHSSDVKFFEFDGDNLVEAKEKAERFLKEVNDCISKT